VKANLPLVNVLPLLDPDSSESARRTVALQLDGAARSHGFFYIVGHGVDQALIADLAQLARAFFSWPKAKKLAIPMSAGGSAWRGYFPLAGELTSGQPDWKEGLYLGTELGPDHPRVRANVILHGANLWPDITGFRETVLSYMHALTALGHILMRGMALGLGLSEDYFERHGTEDPLILLRLFNYPSQTAGGASEASWGVGEHTDYGLLTILWQDDVGGLQVRTQQGWMDAPPIENSFVCNVGDMLDYMTSGRYCSAPHRVSMHHGGRDRISIPFFFDPDFGATITRIPGMTWGPQALARWDGADLRAFEGTYGGYVTSKVSQVFPSLKASLPSPGG
jgi:polar amino acid transport system ATP-binding protein